MYGASSARDVRDLAQGVRTGTGGACVRGGWRELIGPVQHPDQIAVRSTRSRLGIWFP